MVLMIEEDGAEARQRRGGSDAAAFDATINKPPTAADLAWLMGALTVGMRNRLL